MLLFTPYEYWQTLADIMQLNGALEKSEDKVTRVEEGPTDLLVHTRSGKTIECSMVINCTGARNPVESGHRPEILDNLVACGLGVTNHTGGLATSLEGRTQLANGKYSDSVYVCTQASIGLSQPANGGNATFIGANRLTAVRVAEMAQRIADSISETVA
jgi:glycine/D-amino acid oxidase-like deaminating enzyme